jgi:hypothetical protein
VQVLAVGWAVAAVLAALSLVGTGLSASDFGW